jgi:pimeloyl-ACP methyl ester carboxylesterase
LGTLVNLPLRENRRRGHLEWRRTTVAGRPASYGVAGTGEPVVFLHGWALGQHAYKRALKRIVNLGYRVYAPALPGFGGTADLPRDSASFAGYAEWLDALLATLGVEQPVSVIGHSFGGGVAIKLAHDFPERVRSIVLIDAIGHPWERPLWDWGLLVPLDVVSVMSSGQLRSILEDALPNLVRNPAALWRVAQLARGCDLTPELIELRRRGLSATAIWGAGDRLVPRASFDGLCESLGSKGAVVDGSHSWPLTDPDAFAEAVVAAFEPTDVARRGFAS